jgi:hypothetical protein
MVESRRRKVFILFTAMHFFRQRQLVYLYYALNGRRQAAARTKKRTHANEMWTSIYNSEDDLDERKLKNESFDQLATMLSNEGLKQPEPRNATKNRITVQLNVAMCLYFLGSEGE